MRRIGIGVAALIIAVAFLGGCASLGPKYQKVGSVPPGQAIVYIYRESGFIGAGVVYDVKTGPDKEPKVITTLQGGGYYPYVADPGELELWARTESKTSVTLDVKPGQVYYVKGSVGIGIIVGRPHLKLMPEADALKEIADCKLIPDKVAEAKK